MKLCLAQTDIVWEDKSANMRKAREIMAEAAWQGAELVVFPELSLTGFSMNAGLAEPPQGETAEFFTELSGNSGVAAAFGFACSHDGVITNRICIADDGEIIAEYDKIHPFSYGGECAVYSGGDRLCTADIRGVRTGLTICYDLRFPEVYQALSADCELIIVAASWPDKRRAHWETLLRARAIENQCCIVGCNRFGNGGGLYYSGGSAVYSPEGVCMVSADDGSSLLFADIDSGECRRVRSEFPVKNDRKSELYRDFYAK